MVHTQDQLVRGVLLRHSIDHACCIDNQVRHGVPNASLDCWLTECRVFYWIGKRYDFFLFVQASIMTVVQLVLLHVALHNRPPVGAQYSLNKPFAGAAEGDSYVTRPFNFWQWRSRKPFWQFVIYFAVTLAVLQVLIGNNGIYMGVQGYFALGVEAILPIPQVLENERRRSCKGFRLSVLANWLLGDVFKMSYFFLSESSVPMAFKLCGLIQTVCDCYLGLQYWRFGTGEAQLEEDEKKDLRLA